MDLLTLGGFRRLAFPQFSTAESVTAAGTTQATATALVASYNNVTTGAANAGVMLPGAKGGRRVVVFNGTGNTIKVYPNGAADQIDGSGSSTAVTLTSVPSHCLDDKATIGHRQCLRRRYLEGPVQGRRQYTNRYDRV